MGDFDLDLLIKSLFAHNHDLQIPSAIFQQKIPNEEQQST
jgi:hypothetical protein